ncbi:glutamate-cysteine ligase family protein [Hydrogenimonas urashimensis]|uniref:glutamate-cysteine ligase family protein n=1 Tax=Hydrogenimonas urashimensis TaxID=2740515 RepID=UPI0019164B9D|nr:glutamate-cysteine ligase family protein [Hydrogenimonas urashimensis]
MGTEIEQDRFRSDAWPEFSERLRNETEHLKELYKNEKCSRNAYVGGFEIEGWLVDEKMRPAPRNEEFLRRLHDDMASMELAKFNFELNNTPRPLCADAFGQFAAEMHHTCKTANETAENMRLRALSIGILPTLKPSDFCLENMSGLKRYRALNEQVLKERGGRPVELDIAGKNERLTMRHDSVMLEAAATSFQIHTQVPFESAHHYYNAAILASAASVAVSANSPFLFGKTLWHETRIPLFEQSVDTGEGLQRVSFGSGFAKESILECFDENVDAYDILLPILFDAEPEAFAHLRLHNGTIWRWNRPLIGFDEDGTPHFRIEHRVMPSGPTLVDMLANAAFYYGLAASLAPQCAQNRYPADFSAARSNFYAACRDGLDARIEWNDRKEKIRDLVLNTLLPLAREGLESMKIDEKDIERNLGIVETRVAKGQNGAVWQLAYVEKFGKDMQKMTEAYWHHQRIGEPVHTWSVR